MSQCRPGEKTWAWTKMPPIWYIHERVEKNNFLNREKVYYVVLTLFFTRI